MKDRSQNIGWLILFLIASGFFGFISVWLLGIEDTFSCLLTGGILTMIAFGICSLLYLFFMRRIEYQSLWAMLNRGCYHEVNRRIDIDGHEINRLWELKMLACFHSGDLHTFDRLYREHMNEINECKSLAAYIVCILRDLMNALSHDKPPAAFLKNDESKKHSYQKQREYQLYYHIQQGIKEYYGSQKQMCKIHFEQFLAHTNMLSKPLGFYLYALMTTVMAENDHPQTEEYYHKAQQYIFDEKSFFYLETLSLRVYNMQKGTYLMDNDLNRNRNNNSPFDNNQTDLNRSFTFDQPSFRREKNEQSFAPRRHSADIQREFDEMNASLATGNGFSLYEDDGMNMLNQKRMNDVRETNPSSLTQEEFEDDLDPTWFARKKMESNQTPSQTMSYARKTPTMNESNPYTQVSNQGNEPNQLNGNRNPMAQEPMMRTFAFQDDTYQNSAYQRKPQTFAANDPQPQIRRSVEEPAFINQPKPQMTNQRMRPQNERQAVMEQNDERMQDYMSAQNPRMNQNIRNQAAMPMNNQRMTDPNMEERGQNPYQQQYADPRMAQQPSLRAQNELPTQDNKKKKRGSRKKNKQDPFTFENQNGRADPYQNNALPNQAKRKAQPMPVAQPYRTYVKQNVIVFFITLLDAIVVSIVTSSIVYNSFFRRYSGVSSEIISEIIIRDLGIALIIAYLTAGIHTGYTILKKSLRNWSPALKIILSPLLLVLSLLIGVICEIPYLIFASIKKGKE